MKEILLATNNPHKVEEFKKMLKKAEINLDVKTPKDLGLYNFTVSEDGDSFFENSRRKAISYYFETNMPCVADDSGLVIDSLDGEPGLYSARYAGEDCNDKNNIDKVLNNLEDEGFRKASFVADICFYDGKKKTNFHGICDGTITEKEYGENGFGYDPIFRPLGYLKTFAELGSEVKNNISHRAIAFDKFMTYLKERINNETI